MQDRRHREWDMADAWTGRGERPVIVAPPQQRFFVVALVGLAGLALPLSEPEQPVHLNDQRAIGNIGEP
jgi:hypothetical protein